MPVYECSCPLHQQKSVVCCIMFDISSFYRFCKSSPRVFKLIVPGRINYLKIHKMVCELKFGKENATFSWNFCYTTKKTPIKQQSFSVVFYFSFTESQFQKWINSSFVNTTSMNSFLVIFRVVNSLIKSKINLKIFCQCLNSLQFRRLNSL